MGAAPSEAVPDGWHPNLAIELIQKFSLDRDVGEYLSRNYGTRSYDVLALLDEQSGVPVTRDRIAPGFPYTEVEVRYAADTSTRASRVTFYVAALVWHM